jgi:signal transduction histidine kinase
MEELHSTFICNVGHELHTPPTIIHGYTELLYEGGLDTLTHAQHEAMGIVICRVREMVRNLCGSVALRKVGGAFAAPQPFEAIPLK